MPSDRTEPSSTYVQLLLYPLQFITADVYGVFCWTFCDFGDSFEVIDANGEEPKEVFIAKITKVSFLLWE